MDKKNFRSLLFVCTGNSCRSPMAEAIAKSLFPKAIKVGSAGVSACNGGLPSQGAVWAMHKMGLDLSAHRSRYLTPQLIEENDVIACMDMRHKEAVLQLVPSAVHKVCVITEWRSDHKNKGIADPIGTSLDDYWACAQEIAACMKEWIKRSNPS